MVTRIEKKGYVKTVEVFLLVFVQRVVCPSLVQFVMVSLVQLLDGINCSNGTSGGTDNDDQAHDSQLKLSDTLEAVQLEVEDHREDKSQHTIAQSTQQGHHLSKVREEQGNSGDQDHGQGTEDGTVEELSLGGETTLVQLQGSFDLEVEGRHEQWDRQQHMEGDDDGRDRTGHTSGQVQVNGRLDTITIDGVSRSRGEEVKDSNGQGSPENDLVPAALGLHRLFNVREDNVASVREGKGGEC